MELGTLTAIQRVPWLGPITLPVWSVIQKGLPFSGL